MSEILSHRDLWLSLVAPMRFNAPEGEPEITSQRIIDHDEALRARLAEAEALAKRRGEAIRRLLLLIEHETGLPDSAANGNEANGVDEGVVRASEILWEARKALADQPKEGE